MVRQGNQGTDGRRVLVSAESVTVRIRDRHLFAGTSWALRSGEQWGLLGPNGSGKSSFLRALAGLAPTSAGRIRVRIPGGFDAVRYVSLELWERERHRMGRAGVSVRDCLPADVAGLAGPLLPRLRLDREAGTLSTGELRRLLILGALAGQPRVVLLDEPYDGLDAASRATLRSLLRALAQDGVASVTAANRVDELPPYTSHLLLVKDGRVEANGRRESVMEGEAFRRLYPKRQRIRKAAPAPLGGPVRSPAPLLVQMRAVTVRYDETIVFDRLDWAMSRGEHWGVLGPNGSGKTTLLELIYGDNLQAYANDVRVFGRRRGTGESLWEIRSRMGIVSAVLQARYRDGALGGEVVVSGFFDSLGLYRRPTAEQEAHAAGWIEFLGLSGLADRRFDELSYGERRMLIVARAVVKSPELLILDEPCEGLDPSNREAVLEQVDRIVGTGETSLLYVSHIEEELPRCLTHRLALPRPY